MTTDQAADYYHEDYVSGLKNRITTLESSLSRAQEGLEEWVSRSEFAVRVLQRVRADLNDRNFQTEAGAAVEVIKKAITSYRLATEDTKPESKQENKP